MAIADNLSVYIRDDLDGAYSSWLIKKNNPKNSKEIYCTSPSGPYDNNIQGYCNVYLLNTNYDESEIIKLCSRNRLVIVISTMIRVRRLLEWNEKPVNLEVFDMMGLSCSYGVINKLKLRNSATVDAITNIVNRESSLDDVLLYLKLAIPNNLDFFKTAETVINNSLDDASKYGHVLGIYRQQELNSYAASSSLIVLHKCQMLIVNCPHNFRYITSQLAKKAKSGVAISWRLSRYNTFQFTISSTHRSNFDCRHAAGDYGGGGSARSAGFRINDILEFNKIMGNTYCAKR